MPRKKITAAAVERLRAPASGQVDYFDMAFPALALRVTANGVRSWVYFGRVHGKLKRATLGRWPVMSLKAARLKAGEVADTMRAGIDLAAAKRAARLAIPDSFAAVADEWLKRDQADNRSHKKVKAMIERRVKPVWARAAHHVNNPARRDGADRQYRRPRHGHARSPRSCPRAPPVSAGRPVAASSQLIRWRICRSRAPP